LEINHEQYFSSTSCPARDHYAAQGTTVNNNIEEGDTLTLIDLGDGVVVMSPKRSRVDEIAHELARGWQDSGETLESMLSTLREVRAEYGTKKS